VRESKKGAPLLQQRPKFKNHQAWFFLPTVIPYLYFSASFLGLGVSQLRFVLF
jgi:hypothetical protein